MRLSWSDLWPRVEAKVYDRTPPFDSYKYSATRKSALMESRRKVVSAKVEPEIAEAVKKAIGEHPERFQNASSVVREAVVDLLRGLGYLKA